MVLSVVIKAAELALFEVCSDLDEALLLPGVVELVVELVLALVELGFAVVELVLAVVVLMTAMAVEVI